MKVFLIAGTAALVAAACTSTGPREDADAEPDARRGEEVSQVCFNSQIRNWRENDRKSVIVEKGRGDEYLLELVGTCNPQDAFTSIGLISRGASSCLSRGDTLVTDERIAGGSCSIRRIYKWNKDAAEPVEADETEAP